MVAGLVNAVIYGCKGDVVTGPFAFSGRIMVELSTIVASTLVVEYFNSGGMEITQSRKCVATFLPRAQYEARNAMATMTRI